MTFPEPEIFLEGLKQSRLKARQPGLQELSLLLSECLVPINPRPLRRLKSRRAPWRCLAEEKSRTLTLTCHDIFASNLESVCFHLVGL